MRTASREPARALTRIAAGRKAGTAARVGTVALAVVLPGSALSDTPIPVPSGLAVTFHDIHRDTMGDGLTYRFRFIAPEVGTAGHDFLAHSEDMAHLCSEYALERIADLGPRPNRVVISLMAQPVEFGVASPDVVQFFESYSIEDNHCVWEVF